MKPMFKIDILKIKYRNKFSKSENANKIILKQNFTICIFAS